MPKIRCHSMPEAITINEVPRWLRSFRKFNGLSLNKAAKEIGVTQRHLRLTEEKLYKNPTVKTLKAFARWLGVEIIIL